VHGILADKFISRAEAARLPQSQPQCFLRHDTFPPHGSVFIIDTGTHYLGSKIILLSYQADLWMNSRQGASFTQTNRYARMEEHQVAR
jgi:hypothetical protein